MITINRTKTIIKENIDNTKGITLVELLITLALIGIVLSLAYSLLFFGQRTFTKGEGQASIQREARLAANVITKELRYATNLSQSKFSSSTSLYHGLMIENNNLIIYQNSNGTETKRKIGSQPIFRNITFEVVNNRVNFTITVRGEGLGDTDYTISSQVALSNFKLPLSLNGNSIYYIKP